MRKRDLLRRILLYLFRIFPIKNNKIFCLNFNGKGYGGNIKYIVEELLKKEEYEVIWAVENLEGTNFPKKVKKVKIYTLSYLYNMATSKIWINNSRFPIYACKRKKQKYIQTWHGGVGLKKIEYDAFDKMDEYYKKAMVNDTKMTNYMISNSDFCNKMYRRAFKFKGEILKLGSPRNDFLINCDENEVRKKVKEIYNISNETKILLYAPTFRTKYNTKPYDIKLNQIKEILENKTNHKWEIIIRMHPNIVDYNNVYFIYEKNYINATNYPDIQELLVASDLIITDYSSIVFDAMIINKKCMIYAKDINEYKEERGFYFNMNELPFPVAYNNKDVIEIIKNEDINLKKYKEFMDKVGLKEEGTASKEIVKLVTKLIK